MRPFIDFENVSHGYGSDGPLAVDGLTFGIEQGEFAAVVGPSGCGKSTLMKLTTGLQMPRQGYVTVNNELVTRTVKIAGMAFQSPNMLPWRTAIDNILLPLQIVQPHRNQFRAKKAEYRADAEALLERVGLKGQGDRYPWQLSGGMQMRAALCRALIHKPKLLMLDEPFGALDAFTREELWCVIRDLHAETGVTVILVTHDLREAVFLADKVIAMSARPGRILAERRITMPRPRDLSSTFTPEFSDTVQDLRQLIITARQ